MAEEQKGGSDTFEAGPSGFKISTRDKNILGIFQLVAMCMLLYGGYNHTVDAKDDRTAFVQAIKENTQAQRQMVAAQRVANCLNSLTADEKKRQQLIDFCKSLGNGQ